MAKKSKIDDNEFSAPSFPPIGTPPEDKDEGENSADARLAALEAALEAEQRHNRDLQRQMIAALGSKPVSNAEKPVVEPVFDFSDLPDPAVDRDAFFSKLAEKVQSGVKAATVQTVAAVENERDNSQQVAQQFDGLWGQFSESYPDLAKFEDIVEVQTRKILGAAAKKGIPVEQYAFSNPETFLDEVAVAVRRRVEALGLADDDGNDDDDGSVRRVAVKPRRDGSTSGTLGGQRSLARGNPGSKAAKVPTFDEQLKDIQKKMGIF